MASTSFGAPTIARLLREGATRLSAAAVPSARLDAELLLSAATGCDRAAVLTRGETLVSAPKAGLYEAMLTRRAAREPLAYIVGHKEFWSLDFDLSPDVLIPRPETELLVEIALDILRQPRPVKPSVCDVGTGSGCIAIALAREISEISVTAVDLSRAALDIARHNAAKHGVDKRLELVASDLLGAIGPRKFDVVAANPPYVAADALDRLEPELRWEPRSALDGGDGGLMVIRRLLAQAGPALVSGGWLLMEIGAQQGMAVEAMARECGFAETRVRTDYAGMPRILQARAS